MAYGKRYTIHWLTVTNDHLYFDIYKKDYIGAVTELTGAPVPVNINYESGDDKPVNPLKPSSCTVEYINENNTPLLSFYTEDAEMYRGELRDANDDSLRWAGFLVLDDCKEKFTSTPYIVSLVFTDNLGLLKQKTYQQAAEIAGTSDFLTMDALLVGAALNFPGVGSDLGIQVGQFVTINGIQHEIVYVEWHPEAGGNNQYLQVNILTSPGPFGIYSVTLPVAATTNLIAKPSIWSIISTAIKNTGIALPVRVFNDLYEITNDESRNMFEQVRVFTGKWIDVDGVWLDMYSIVEEILSTFHATLMQADGYWNVIRWGGVFRAPDNVVSGFEYDAVIQNPIPITFALNYDPITPETDVEMIGADAEIRILRPLKYVRQQFEYKQPRELIQGLNLQTPGPFIESEVDGNIRYDRYHINQTWRHEDNAPTGTTPDTSIIEVVTETNPFTLQETELDRYIKHFNTDDDNFQWLQLTPIEVSENDYFTFKYQFKAATHTPDATFRIHTRPLLFTPSGSLYVLTAVGGGLQWNFFASDDLYKVSPGLSFDSPETDTEWSTFDLLQLITNESHLPPFPEDGILIIGLAGTSNTLNNGSTSKADTLMKDFDLEFFSRINETTNIIGHYHMDETSADPKNVYDEEITIDDSPRNTIAGTLFTDIITQFAPNIGAVYFTKTTLWGLKGEAKTQRLGQFITNERHRVQRQARSLVDCSFVFDCPLLTPLNIIFISAIIDFNFIFGVCSFDMMNMVCSGATLWEMHYTGETEFITDYTFKYLYRTT